MFVFGIRTALVEFINLGTPFTTCRDVEGYKEEVCLSQGCNREKPEQNSNGWPGDPNDIPSLSNLLVQELCSKCGCYPDYADWGNYVPKCRNFAKKNILKIPKKGIIDFLVKIQALHIYGTCPMCG